MDFINLLGLALISLIISVTLKKHLPEYAVIINIVSGVLITYFLISKAVPIVEYIKNLFLQTKVSGEYIAILFKSLGICFISQFAYDACIDAGEKSLASKIELACKLGIFTCALPLFKQITQTALKFAGC